MRSTTTINYYYKLDFALEIAHLVFLELHFRMFAILMTRIMDKFTRTVTVKLEWRNVRFIYI